MHVEDVADYAEHIEMKMQNRKRYVKIENADLLLLTLLLYPDTHSLHIEQQRDSPSQRQRPWPILHEKFNYEFIPLFKELHNLEIDNLELENKTSRFILQNKSVTSLRLNHSTLNESFAKQLLKNKTITSLTLYWCDVDEKFMTTVVKHETIEELIMDLIQGLDVDDEKEHARIVTALLKNEVLTHVELSTYTGRDDQMSEHYFTSAEDRQINEMIQLNRQRLQTMMDVLPLLAGTQLGGTYRHSIIGLLPKIYGYMGEEVPSQSGYVSELIEPIVASGIKRTFSQSEDKPLPRMFK